MERDHSVPYGTSLLIGILFFQQLLAALTFPIAKFGLSHIEPFTFAFFRYIISSAVLLGMVWVRKPEKPVQKPDRKRIWGLGILIIPLNQTAYLVGQKFTAAGHGAILFATVPLWIFILAIFHLKERFDLRRGLGVLIGLVGVGILLVSGRIEIGMSYLLGDCLILIAVIAWAYYSILGKRLVQQYGAIRMTAYAMAAGTLIYFPFGVYRALRFDYAGVPLTAWLSVLYVVLGVSVLAYILWYWLLKYLDATRIAVFHNLQPVFATIAAYLILGETIGLPFLLGGLVVLGGVIITESGAKYPQNCPK